jgi:predicted transcriptional regulator
MSTAEVKANIDYEFINNWLEYGQRKEIAENLGITPHMAYKYLSGEGFHKEFLEACYKQAFDNANKWIAQAEQAKLLKEKIAAL